MKAFDFFSQIYCSKFEEGHFESVESETLDQHYDLGIYGMLSDIRDQDYVSQNTQYGQDKPKSKKDINEEVAHIFWWVGFVIMWAFGCMYCVGVYFTYFEASNTFAKDFKNEKVPGNKGKAKVNLD